MRTNLLEKFCLFLIFFICSFLVSCSSREDNNNLMVNPSLPANENKIDEKGDSNVLGKVDSQEKGTNEQKVYGKVIIVDSSGAPVEKVGAIATFKPNAFDEPFAWGNLSGKDGISEIWVPKNTHMYIRAWDPELRYFPINFYEIPPTDADALEEMTIKMMESAVVEMTLIDFEDKAIANENVGLMMIHHKYGAWWPCQGYTDSSGNVVFKPLPPGIFDLRIKTERGIILEIKEVSLPPGSHTVLGKIKSNYNKDQDS